MISSNIAQECSSTYHVQLKISRWEVRRMVVCRCERRALLEQERKKDEELTRQHHLKVLEKMQQARQSDYRREVTQSHMERCMSTAYMACTYPCSPWWIEYLHCVVSIVALLFTARCTLVQSAVLRSHVVRLSVCDVGELWSHRLESFRNNFTIS